MYMSKFKLKLIVVVITLLYTHITIHKASALVNNMFYLDPTIANDSIDPDGTFLVDININTNFSLAGLTIDFSYSNQAIELIGSSCTNVFSQCDITNNRIIASSIDGITGSETIATLKFQILDPNYQDNTDLIAFYIDHAKGVNDTAALIGEPLIIWQSSEVADDVVENNSQSPENAAKPEGTPNTGSTAGDTNGEFGPVAIFCAIGIVITIIFHYIAKRIIKKHIC